MGFDRLVALAGPVSHGLRVADQDRAAPGVQRAFRLEGLNDPAGAASAGTRCGSINAKTASFSRRSKLLNGRPPAAASCRKIIEGSRSRRSAIIDPLPIHVFTSEQTVERACGGFSSGTGDALLGASAG